MINNRRTNRIKRGFSLIELAIAIAIIAVLGALVANLTDSSGRGKAVSLWQIMQEKGRALLMMKTDTGCHTRRLDGLYNNAINTATNTFCGVAIPDNAWKGPYLQPFNLNSSNQAIIDNIISGVTLEIKRETSTIGFVYFIQASNVPNSLIKQALQECNGSPDATTAAFTHNKCRGILGVAPIESGTFDVRYDETR